MIFGDIKSPRLIVAKGILFLLLGILAGTLLIIGETDSENSLWKRVLLLGICIWAFCRAYYFAFYVIGNYVDPTFKYAGLMSAVRFLLKKRRTN